MHAPHPPSLTGFMRALAVGIVMAFTLSAVSIAYAAGRHASHQVSSGSSSLSAPTASWHPPASGMSEAVG
jgi:hypothetical protein